MKIYLAHNYAAKEWLATHVIPQIEVLGHEVTSRWIRKAQFIDPYHPNIQIEESQMDVEDVRRADVLVLFTDNFGGVSARPGRGKYVEFGMALAWKKMIVLCGQEQTDTVFYFLPELVKVKSLDELLESIACVASD